MRVRGKGTRREVLVDVFGHATCRSFKFDQTLLLTFFPSLSNFQPPIHKFAVAMSFAGRRRGNKVKKGVQFTVMVVGAFFQLSFSLAI